MLTNWARRAPRHRPGGEPCAPAVVCMVRCAGPGQRHGAGALRTGQRGLMRVPALMAETRFPLGLFRAWTVLAAGRCRCWCIRSPSSRRRRCRRRSRSPGRRRRTRAAAWRRVRRRAQLPARRCDAPGGVEEGRPHRRTGQPRHQRERQPRAVARLRRCGLVGCRGATVATGGVDAGRRAHRAGLRAAHSRRRAAAVPRRRRNAAPRSKRWRCGDR